MNPILMPKGDPRSNSRSRICVRICFVEVGMRTGAGIGTVTLAYLA
jgi:hypothetical protein